MPKSGLRSEAGRPKPEAGRPKPGAQDPGGQTQWRLAYKQRVVAHQEILDAKVGTTDGEAGRTMPEAQSPGDRIPWRLAYKQRVVAHQEMSDAEIGTPGGEVGRPKPEAGRPMPEARSRRPNPMATRLQAASRRSSRDIGCPRSEVRGPDARIQSGTSSPSDELSPV